MRKNDRMTKVVDFTVEEDIFDEDIVVEDDFDESVIEDDDYDEKMSSDVEEKKTHKASYISWYDDLYYGYGVVRDTDFLPLEEQKVRNLELIATVQSADSSDEEVKEAMNALILENRRLIYRIVRRYEKFRPSDKCVKDLISAGVFTFMNAVKKYDHTLSPYFFSYASKSVKNAIRDACGLSRKNSKITQVFSLDEKLCNDSDTEFIDLLADEDWSEDFDQIERHDQVQVVLSMLSESEIDLIDRRFNLQDKYDKPWSLEKLSKEFGLCREGMRLYFERLFNKMRPVA